MYSLESQEIKSGAILVILILKIVEVEPPVLFAQIVQVSQEDCTSLAIPEIVPLAELNWKPGGK